MRFGAAADFWLLLLVPLATMLLIWARMARRKALSRFVSSSLVPRLIDGTTPGRQLAKGVLLVLALVWFVLALTRPQFGTKLSLASQRGVDLVIALDVSRSMLAEDIRPNRLKHAVQQVRELMNEASGNRVALVLFAGKAFLQCPLTLDYGAVSLFLDLADAGSIPVQGTALEDALRVAGRCFDVSEDQHKAIVLFTDGENHVGKPVAEARRLAARGVRIFTVGIGTPAGELVPVRSDSGRVSFLRDSQGNPVKSRLDEDSLDEIARAAGGEYYRSTLGGTELAAIAKQVAGMGGRDLGSRRFTQYEQRYRIPCALALLCIVLEAVLSDGGAPSREWRGRFA